MATAKKAATKKAATKKTATKSETPKKAATKKAAAPKKAATKKAATKKASSGGKTNKLGVKNSLVNNINAKKKKGTAHTKKDSTVSKENYKHMEEGWDKKD